MNIEFCLEANLSELGRTFYQTNVEQGERLVQSILEARRVFLSGRGRSGLVMKMFAMRLMQMGLCAYVVGETTTPAISTGDLWFAGSSSGEVPGLLQEAHLAAQAGAILAAITSHPNSSLAKIAGKLIILNLPKEGGDKNIVGGFLLGTLFEQAMLLYSDCLCIQLAERIGQTNAELRARHANLE